MPDARIYLIDFALENPIYSDAVVGIYKVDPVTNLRTEVLADVYDGLNGTTLLANPQTLDGSGKWQQAVYVAGPVIMKVHSGNLPTHQTGIQRGPCVADEGLLRAYGAKLDGISDDAPAFQAILADALTSPFAWLQLPTVIFELPLASILIASIIDSGGVNCMVRGAGPNISVLGMRAGSPGAWVHGTQARPARGYLHFEDFTLRDLATGGTGSGVPPLSAHWGPDAAGLGNGFTLRNMAFRGFGVGLQVTNLPRGWECSNVVVFGPDYGLVAGGGFNVTSTPDGVGGAFSYTFTNVLVSNFTWGWDFDINLPLEGVIFTSCRAYNGWGFCNADASLSRSSPGDLTPYYRSVLWEFTSCDWQGFGFALNMNRCRDITVRGGFWIFDALKSGVAAPVAGRRAMFNFQKCTEVLVDGAELAAGPACVDDFDLVRTDDDTIYAVFRGLQIVSFAPNPHAAFAIANLAAPNLVTETATQWVTWLAGSKVLDASSQQAMETIVARENTPGDGRGFYGTMDAFGRYTLAGLTQTLFTSEDRHVVVQFPTRPNGSPFFIGGPPRVVATAVNTLSGSQSPTIFLVNTFGFVMAFDSDVPQGYQVQISWTATGL
jgi:hypothetical protein